MAPSSPAWPRARPGGRLALSAFSAYFVMKHWDGADFDADAGVNHERTEIRDEAGAAVETSLWTGCYTPRELRLLCAAHGLAVDSISSVEPGAYGSQPPTADTAEFLAARPPRPRTALEPAPVGTRRALVALIRLRWAPGASTRSPIHPVRKQSVPCPTPRPPRPPPNPPPIRRSAPSTRRATTPPARSCPTISA